MAFFCCGRSKGGKNAKGNNIGDEELHHSMISEIKDMFQIIDEDKNGLISKEEIMATFRNLRLPVKEAEIVKMMSKYDSNGDEHLDYGEFCKLMKEYINTKEYPVTDMFKYFDMDGDGLITIEEFVKSMRCLGVDMTDEKAETILPEFYATGTNKVALTDRKDIFDLFDQDRNGMVTKSEIITTFTELKMDICDDYATMLISEFDRNGDGQLEFSEFISLVKKFMKVKNYPIEGMFNYFDIDGDGFITTDEFIKSMRCIGVDITTESAREMLQDYYTSGTEKIGYESFNEMMRRFL